MKLITVLSILTFFLFAGAGTVCAQSAANSKEQARQFELAAKANNFSTAYKFVVDTKSPDDLATFCQGYDGIDAVFCTSKFAGAKPGSYCFMVNTEGSQYGIDHLKGMLKKQGYQNVEVTKMK